MNSVGIYHSNHDLGFAAQVEHDLRERGIGTELFDYHVSKIGGKKKPLIMILSEFSGKLQSDARELERAIGHGQTLPIISLLRDHKAKNNWIWPLIANLPAVGYYEDENWFNKLTSLLSEMGVESRHRAPVMENNHFGASNMRHLETGSSNFKRRLVLLREHDVKRLSELRQSIGTTEANVVSKSVELLSLLLREHESGSTFFIQRKNKENVKVDIFTKK